MLDFGTLLSGFNFAMAAKERSQSAETEEKIDQLVAQHKDADSDVPGEISLQEQQLQRLDELLAHEQANEPGPAAKDAFASSTFELSPGDTVVVTIEPDSGWNLRVKEVHFDRRDEHDYTINVGGDVNSVSHRAKYARPKLVSQSDRVVAQVTNNSSVNTVIDFEMSAWSEEP